MADRKADDRVSKMLSYRSMKQNKTLNEDTAANRWSLKAPELDANEPPSKTQLKAIADAQQALGVKLCALPKDKVLQLKLPEALEEAVLESHRIKANGATRRHKQFVGKLMREVDPEPIETQLAKWEGKDDAENARFHLMERWRDQLIDDDEALTKFLESYPQADRQQLRTLIRNTKKEITANKPPKSSRELFKQIRFILENQ